MQTTDNNKNLSQEKEEPKETKLEERKELKVDKPLKKHPLQYSWTLWYDCPPRKNSAETFSQFFQKVYTFSTVL